MKDLILSTPVFSFYQAFVVTLFLTAVWNRERNPPRGTARTTGPGVADVPLAARGNLDWARLQSAAWPRPRDRRLFRDLQAALSAAYAVMLEQAVRTIRLN